MAEPRRRKGTASAKAMLFAFAVFTAAAWWSGALGGPLEASISGPAVATEPADRITPPGPSVGGCTVFPADNPWNQDISSAPLRSDSAAIIGKVAGSRLHPDFGSDPTYGIPYAVVPETQPKVAIDYAAYGDESDPGPFPIPKLAPVEGGANAGGDRHVLVVQQGSCRLYELYRAFLQQDGSWKADSGATWDLSSNALRTLGWTSADAAGLPILPGLVRYDEVAAGAIHHAIRVTFSTTSPGYILPATHQAPGTNAAGWPVMGMRFRLRADYDVSKLTGAARVIAVAMQHYGLIVADNGSNWFFQGGTDARWNDDDLNQLKAIPGSVFDVVDTGAIQAG